MLAKANRFHGGRDIQHVYKKARVYRGRFFGLRVLDRQSGGLRAVVVVSKKVNKSAVVRNRIRRRIYELIRTRTALSGNTQVIVNVYDDVLALLPASEVAAEFSKLLSKAGLAAQESAKRDIVEGKEE